MKKPHPRRRNAVFIDGKWRQIVRQKGEQTQYLCQKCGRWVCEDCGHRQREVNRQFVGTHRCPKCGSTEGKWTTSYHASKVWEDHNGKEAEKPSLLATSPQVVPPEPTEVKAADAATTSVEDEEIGTMRLDGRDLPRVKITKAGARRYLCGKCGTWVCNWCGHQRTRANRAYSGVHRCTRCGGTVGRWLASYHTEQMWTNHYGHVPIKSWVRGDHL